jgi:hypothetical protein
MYRIEMVPFRVDAEGDGIPRKTRSTAGAEYRVQESTLFAFRATRLPNDK